MIELLINGELVTGIDEILLTKAVSDIGTISSREGEYSTSIEVPQTKSNLAALNYTHQFGNVVSLGSKRLSYELYESGVLISGGLSRVLKIKETLSIVLFGGNSDWLAQMGDATLQDLDMSELDYLTNKGTVSANRLNTEKFCLANVLYTDATFWYYPSQPFDVGDFMPIFFIKYLIEKIVQSKGYSVNFTLLPNNQAMLDKEVLIPNKVWTQNQHDGIAYKCSIAPSDNGGAGYGLGLSVLYLGGDILFVQNMTSKYGGNPLEIPYPYGFPTTGKGATLSTTRYMAQKIENSVNFGAATVAGGFIEIEISSVVAGLSVNVSLFDPATNTQLIQLGKLVISSNGTYSIYLGWPISSLSNQIVSFNIGLYIIGGLGVEVIKILGGEVILYDDTAINQIQQQERNNDIMGDVSGMLPNVKQSDLLLTVVNQFGLLLTTDYFNKVVTFTQLDAIRANIPQAIDWSDKVDFSEPPEVLFDFFDNYYKKSWFAYSDDDKDPNLQGSQNGYLSFTNENLEDNGLVFQSQLCPIQRIDYIGNQIAASQFRLYQGMKPKIARVEITTNNLITQYTMPAPVQSNEVFFKGLEFADLLLTNYNLLKRALANNKAVKLLVRLTRADFANVDFSIPIFLDIQTDNGQIRGNFFINQIDQYSVGANESCEITLINID